MLTVVLFSPYPSSPRNDTKTHKPSGLADGFSILLAGRLLTQHLPACEFPSLGNSGDLLLLLEAGKGTSCSRSL